MEAKQEPMNWYHRGETPAEKEPCLCQVLTPSGQQWMVLSYLPTKGWMDKDVPLVGDRVIQWMPIRILVREPIVMDGGDIF